MKDFFIKMTILFSSCSAPVRGNAYLARGKGRNCNKQANDIWQQKQVENIINNNSSLNSYKELTAEKIT